MRAESWLNALAGFLVLVGCIAALAAATNSIAGVPAALSWQERTRTNPACLGVRPGTPEPWCDVKPYVAPMIRCDDCCLDCGLLEVEPPPHRLRPEPTSHAALIEGLEAIEREAQPSRPTVEIEALTP